MAEPMSTETPLDAEEFGRWRDEAGRALAAARLQADAGLHNWACFMAEQAAQLALKALLHGLGRGPWGHDLLRLGEMAREAGLDASEIEDALRRLSRHYIPARYPDAHPSGPAGTHYGPTDAQEAVRDAERTLGFVDRAWQRLGG